MTNLKHLFIPFLNTIIIPRLSHNNHLNMMCLFHSLINYILCIPVYYT